MVTFDTIIILDAMRYDMYPRKAKKAKAKGMCTSESIPKMFSGKYENTVYVSGNPVINSFDRINGGYRLLDHFESVADVWDSGWDWSIKTVPPWSVLEETVKYQMSGKRVVAHFMQPHYPYIGDVKLKDDMSNIVEAYKANVSLVIQYAERAINGTTLITSDHGELLGEGGYIGHVGTLLKNGNHVSKPDGGIIKEILLSVPKEVIY